MKRKGIILAGGSGTRLYPVTLAASKQLVPIYNKPMVYYPLGVLMLGGIREFLVITTPEDNPAFRRLLEDGSRWGVAIDYAVQPKPEGLAQALTIAERWLDGAPSALILGDNLFFGHGLPEHLAQADAQTLGATVFATAVENPQDYGVVSFDAEDRAVTLEEKPKEPRSSFAVTGLYYYDSSASAKARALKPSPRGELEITDLNRCYLDEGTLTVQRLGRGFAWLDTGSHASMLAASNFVQTVEQRQGLMISCPEEIAFRSGWIDEAQLRALAQPLSKNDYGRYLLKLLEAPL